MDIDAYISSGILEAYCLGLAADTERQEVEHYAIIYPGIRDEIDRINDSLEEYAFQRAIEPAPQSKIRLLLSVYERSAGTGKAYPPLIRENTSAEDFREWISGQPIPSPAVNYDNLFICELPSTATVTNFMVWAKEGHDEEEHEDYNEFIVILSGHCDMYFDDKKIHYETGEIIFIPPRVTHHAVITSDTPMIAIVQRQLIAA